LSATKGKQNVKVDDWEVLKIALDNQLDILKLRGMK